MAVAISLKNLRNFLYPIKLKWYDLGIELDIPGEELDEIKSKNRDDYGACLRDMITVRLKFRDDPLTWGHLEAALKARAINELELAEKAKENNMLYEDSIFDRATSDGPLVLKPSRETVSAQPSWKFPSTIKRYTITELSCYHGALRGEEAEEKLKQQPGDSHLIRYSDSKGEYILSVLKRGDSGPIYQHFIIKTKLHERNLYSVEGSEMTFHDVSKMLKYFRKNPIYNEITGIGKPCNHNHTKATHYSSSDDSDSSDDWQDTLETPLTPPPLVTKPQRSPEQPQLPALGEPSTQLADHPKTPKLYELPK